MTKIKTENVQKKKGSYRAKKPKEKIETKNEYFPTYHGLTYALLDEIDLRYYDVILEPCAGNSDIPKAILEHSPNKNISFIQYDINPRNENVKKANFLKLEPTLKGGSPRGCNTVITNPPFTLFKEFLFQCAKWTPYDIYFLAPLDYLHGSERYEELFKNGFMGMGLKTVYAFERRPNFENAFNHDPRGKIPTGATSFAWFHFQRGWNQNYWIGKHLIIKKYMGTPTHKDQLSLLD